MPIGFGLCPALGTFFALAAAILLIFVNVGQISDSQTVPRHIQIIDITTYGVGNALATLANVDIAAADAVYGNVNQTKGSYDVGSGLRYTYSWGLWSACPSQILPVGSRRSRIFPGRCGGYGNSLSQIQFCTSTQFAEPFQPFQQVLLRDVPGAQNTTLLGVIPDGTFTADNYLGSFSKAAFYLIFIGAILNGLALLVGFAAHHIAFLFASALAFLAFLCELVGASLFCARVLPR